MLLLLKLLKARVFVNLFTFISLVLMAVLLCSCVSSGLRHIPLVYSDTSSTSVHIGYLGICLNSNCSTTSIGHINSTSLTPDLSGSAAVKFRDHSIRPYFMLISICAMGCSYLVGLMTICLEGKVNLNPVTFGLLSASWAATIIAAVWQEVAVHSAVVFLQVSKGNQASGMIWATVALLTVALVLQAFKRQTIDPNQDIPEKV